jgi:hypothetical protein
MAKAELVLIGTDDGVVLLSNPGGIGRWLKSAHALRGRIIVATWAHPNDPTQLLCSDASHMWRSIDGGQQWEQIDGPACQRIIASRTSPERIWAHDGHMAYLSHDAGTTWQTVAPADQIAGGGDVLWYSHANEGFLSTSGGTTWEPTPTWQHVVISHDGQHLWYGADGSLGYAQTRIDDTPTDFVPVLACAGAARVVGASASSLWSYADDWHLIELLHGQSIAVLATTLYHPDRAWAGDTAGNVWYSSDRCLTWELIRGGFVSIHALATARLL